MKILFALLMAAAISAQAAGLTNVYTGSAPNAGDGDSARAAFVKLNTNCAFLDAKINTASNALQTGVSGASIPAGLIAMWSWTLASVPSGWHLCDGASGTPDLRDKFIKGWAAGVDPGGTGGGAYTPAGTVTQPTFTGTPFTSVINHTHDVTITDPGHSHTQSVNSATSGTLNGYGVDTSTATWSASGFKVSTNTTGITASSANPAGGVASITPAGTVSQPTFSGTSATVEPAYFKLAFIMKL